MRRKYLSPVFAVNQSIYIQSLFRPKGHDQNRQFVTGFDNGEAPLLPESTTSSILNITLLRANSISLHLHRHSFRLPTQHELLFL